MTLTTIAPPLAHALQVRGYDQLTPVQESVLQDVAQGRDLLVSAQTGSGKTVAFGLAMAPNLLGDAQTLPPPGAPLAIVVAPTRELAMQVHAELSWLYAEAGGRVAVCVGGMDPKREQRALMAGAHIVVGTPGRLCDHINRRQLRTDAVRIMVLDEADEMLDLGFREDLEFILGATPAERRTLLFSATLPREIVSLARRFQRDALRLDTGGSRQPHNDIAYAALRVASGETVPAVINVLRYHDAPVAIVFCPTRDSVKSMWNSLTARGFSAVALSGEMGQGDRNQALVALRSGRARVCVATDVAARGLDLPELSLVIHAELPMNPQLLLHRSGRTGRAGRKGASVLLVTQQRRARAEAMLAQAGVAAEWGPVPDAAAIRIRDHERMLSDPMLAEVPDEAEVAAAAALLESHAPESLAVALLRLYRDRLPQEAQVIQITGPQRAAAAPRDARLRQTAAGIPERGERAPRPTITEPVWLSANIGQREQADPKWVLPLLCRLGGVTRQEIGLIRILSAETRFEVPADMAEQFIATANAAEPQEVQFTRSQAPTMADRPAPRAPRPAEPAGRPKFKKQGKPFKARKAN